MRKLRYYLLVLLIFFSYTGTTTAQGMIDFVDKEHEKVIPLNQLRGGLGEVKVYVKNTYSTPVEVQVTESSRNPANFDVEFYYCWDGQCLIADDLAGSYTPPVMMEPGQKMELKIQIYTSEVGISETTYSVVARDDNGNEETKRVTFRLEITEPVSAEKDIRQLHASLTQPFPNPATSQTTLNYHIPASSSNATLKVYDLFGKRVDAFRLQPGSTRIQLHVKDYSAGLYFCSLEINNKAVATRRLLVK